MTISSESDRQRYAQELAAYTLRQFSAARSSADPAKLVKATASTSQQKHQQRTNKAPGTLGDLGDRKGVAAAPGLNRDHHQPKRKKRFFIP